MSEIKTQHTCPYGSRSSMVLIAFESNAYDGRSTERSYKRVPCGGDTGWLCDRCKEDRADERADRRPLYLR